jgi:hypothetical protein
MKIHIILTALAFACIPQLSTAQGNMVFNDTVNPGLPEFGPGAAQVGNEITLGGDARQITDVSWLVYSQNWNVMASIEMWIYANNGSSGAPGTLLWSSGLLTGIKISPNDTSLDVAVPNIVVPDTITITSIVDATPVALGRVFGGSASVGGVDASWVQTYPGLWYQQSFPPYGMRVVAVPEPSSVSLMIIACAMLAGALRYSSRDSLAKHRPPRPLPIEIPAEI